MLENLKCTVGKVGLKVAAKKPEIFLAAGVASIVGGAVMIAKGSFKAVDILEEHKKNLEAIEKVTKMTEEDQTVSYSEEDAKRDLMKAYVKTGVELFKVYLPAVGLILGGITLIVTSHSVMAGRYNAMVSAYNAAVASRDAYKAKLEKFAKDQGIENLDDILAKEQADAPEVMSNLPTNFFEYAIDFDSRNPNWKHDYELNHYFIEANERYFNERLRTRGYVLLNEVYEALGAEPTKEGSIIGWVFDTSADSITKNVIEFTIYDLDDFEPGMYEDSCMLIDFNVDGVVYNIMN